MAHSTFQGIRISGVVTVVPKTIRCIDDEVDLYGGNAKQIARIKRALGLDKRHVVQAGTTSLDLCVEAAEQLMAGLAVDRGQVDGLIFVTQTPDHLQPANAAIAHGRLKLGTDTAAFDVALGCSGYVYGLWMAHMMIASKTCSRVLLLAGDTLSRCVHERDRSTASLFGDAGTATLIEAWDTPSESYFSLHTDGTGCGHIIIPAGGFRKPSTPESQEAREDADGNWRSENDLFMNGGEVFDFSIKTEPAAIQAILSHSGEDLDDLDYLIFHQANRYILSNIAKRLQVSLDKVPCDTVGRYGNQSSASIPCTINDALQAVFLEGKKRVLLSGFGVGLSWASAIIDLDKLYCPPVLFFDKEES